MTAGALAIEASAQLVWNCFNEEIHKRRYFDHRDSIYTLELFENKEFLASGGRDRSIKIWKL